jgi:hypothetical protein
MKPFSGHTDFRDSHHVSHWVSKHKSCCAVSSDWLF